jgi:hexosaminidase
MLFAGGVACAASSSAGTDPLNLMPMPASVSRQSWDFPIHMQLHIEWSGYKNALLARAADRFLDRLNRRTGIVFVRSGAFDKDNVLAIHCGEADPNFLSLHAKESYELRVGDDGVRLDAPGPTGVLRGLATLIQLATQEGQGFVFPDVTIHDEPRFAWRGVMIDVSRHFMPLGVLERQLDAMEELKFNVLHLHLSDAESFSIASRRYPLLQEKGATNGQYYTQEQIRELIRYARDRGIRVVPEFDVPGHTRSWFAGYPELTSPLYRREDEHTRGDAVIDPTNPYVYRFLSGFFAEMGALFPDTYFHAGGDEVSGKQWGRDPHIVGFMKTHSMSDTADLQAYFTRRVSKILRADGKVMIGWDEILGPTTPRGAVMEVWHKSGVATKAIESGHPVIIAGPYYLDELKPAAYYYRSDPLGAAKPDLTAKERSLILGGEAEMWTEMTTAEMLDAALWPRAAAIAERLWSRESVRNIDDMYRRLDGIDYELEILGTRQYENRLRMVARIDPEDAQTVLRLAEVVEPIKGTARWHVVKKMEDPPSQNTLADAVFPESLTGVRFNMLAQTLVAAHGGDGEAGDTLRHELRGWRDNDSAFVRAAGRASALEPYVDVSQQLSELAAAGLDAVDAIQGRCALSAEWSSKADTLLEKQLDLAAGHPQPSSQVLIAIVPGVEALVREAQAEGKGSAEKVGCPVKAEMDVDRGK